MRYKRYNPAKKWELAYDRDMCLSKQAWEAQKVATFKERARNASHRCSSVQKPGVVHSVEEGALYAHMAAERLWAEAVQAIWMRPETAGKIIKKAEAASQHGREADLAYHGCMAEIEAEKAKRAARSNPGNPVAFSRSTDVQTLLFPKDRFTVASARAWAERHNFRAGKVDTGSATAGRLRVRQREPSAFQKGSFRTILLDRAHGVEAVIGKPAVRGLRRNPTYEEEVIKYNLDAIKEISARRSPDDLRAEARRVDDRAKWYESRGVDHHARLERQSAIVLRAAAKYAETGEV